MTAPKHVVVVVLDDVGVDLMACYGEHSGAGPTPNLAAMAASGVMFRRAYANPTCSPSRCSALTGLYPARTLIGGGTTTSAYAPSNDLPWLPRLLTEAGVYCAAVGKWHLAPVEMTDYRLHPISVGFARYAGCLSILNYFPGDAGYYDWTKTTSQPGAYQETHKLTYATSDTAYDALQFLNWNATLDRQSFLWLAFNAPHGPWTAGEAPPSGSYAGNWSTGTNPQRQRMTLESLDTHIGQLRAAYAAAHPEAAEQTLWIVVGDNGTPPASTTAPWDPGHAKPTVYEGGVRVPLFACGAGVCATGECDAPVGIVDIWAAVLDAFGVTPPGGHTDSTSFLPALHDPASFTGRGWSYARGHSPNGAAPYTSNRRAVVGADGWKLIVQDDGSHELYYLPSDPLETDDLWPPDAGAQQDRADALQAIIDACDEASP